MPGVSASFFLQHHSSGATPVSSILQLLGCTLWTVAYISIIIKAFRDRVYGMPWPSTCLNITWELYYGFLCRGVICQTGLPQAVTRAWLLLDAVIVFQLFYYGRAFQSNRELKRYFYPMVSMSLLLAYIGQVTFTNYNHDPAGVQDAWLINTGMSLFFVTLCATRPALEGLSYPGAWAKMLANLSLAAGLVMAGGEFSRQPLPLFLFATTFLADSFYVFLLHIGGRKHGARPLLGQDG